MTKKIKSLAQAVELSLKASETQSIDADFSIEVEGNQWTVYEVSISHQDILCFCEQGTATFLVDTYGNDKSFATLHDWEKEEVEPFDGIYNAVMSDTNLDQDQKDRLTNLISDFLYVDEGFEAPETVR